MRISDILDESMIQTHVPGNTKHQIIDRMIEIISTSNKVQDKDKVKAAIYDREKIMSTGVGNGFAIPHGKTDAVSDVVAAFAVTEEPINYESLDEQPVRLVFLLVGRDSMVGPHIKLLSRISRLMNKEEFRKKLLAADTPKAVMEVFKTEEATYFDL
jgi:fructose PTS system EIIBC or EIIC component